MKMPAIVLVSAVTFLMGPAMEVDALKLQKASFTELKTKSVALLDERAPLLGERQESTMTTSHDSQIGKIRIDGQCQFTNRRAKHYIEPKSTSIHEFHRSTPESGDWNDFTFSDENGLLEYPKCYAKFVDWLNGKRNFCRDGVPDPDTDETWETLKMQLEYMVKEHVKKQEELGSIVIKGLKEHCGQKGGLYSDFRLLQEGELMIANQILEVYELTVNVKNEYSGETLMTKDNMSMTKDDHHFADYIRNATATTRGSRARAWQALKTQFDHRSYTCNKYVTYGIIFTLVCGFSLIIIALAMHFSSTS